MCKKIPYLDSHVIWPPAMNLSVYQWRYNAHKLIPSFPHIIILLPILLIDWSHTTREISIWEQDTCADVNIMPVSIYKLVFQDPDCKKLAPSKLEISTYTTDIVQLVCTAVCIDLAHLCYLLEHHLYALMVYCHYNELKIIHVASTKKLFLGNIFRTN